MSHRDFFGLQKLKFEDLAPGRVRSHLVRAAFAWGCLVALVVAQDGSGAGGVPKKDEALSALDYSRHERSILSNHCFKCHGPDEKERKGGLRLDLHDAALKPGESGKSAIVPGKPAESVLVARITSSDPGTADAAAEVQQATHGGRDRSPATLDSTGGRAQAALVLRQSAAARVAGRTGSQLGADGD